MGRPGPNPSIFVIKYSLIRNQERLCVRHLRKGYRHAQAPYTHNCTCRQRGYLFGSDDQGETWTALRDASPFSPANESKILELSDGTWMINARLNGSGHRYIHRSNDNGKNWSGSKDSSLPDPDAMQNLFSTPASWTVIRKIVFFLLMHTVQRTKEPGSFPQL